MPAVTSRTDPEPPSAWQVERALTEGRLTLDEHTRLLDSYRARSVALFGAVSVAIGFLAGRGHPNREIGWSRAAIATYALMTLCLVAVNIPVTLRTHLDPATLLDPRWNKAMDDDANVDLAKTYGKAVSHNNKAFSRLAVAFGMEVMSGGASIVCWSIALFWR